MTTTRDELEARWEEELAVIRGRFPGALIVEQPDGTPVVSTRTYTPAHEAAILYVALARLLGRLPSRMERNPALAAPFAQIAADLEPEPSGPYTLDVTVAGADEIAALATVIGG